MRYNTELNEIRGMFMEKNSRNENLFIGILFFLLFVEWVTLPTVNCWSHMSGRLGKSL